MTLERKNISNSVRKSLNLIMHNCALFLAIVSQMRRIAGWGTNNTIVFGKHKVFVKSIPMTDTEYSNMFSTKNLYSLPTYCNYGVGSPGFGVFRELVTCIKMTNWVLEREIATFPLMYHYRVLLFSKQRKNVDRKWLKEYVACWGKSENVGKYISERINANHKLVLFIEYIPYVLAAWLKENPDKLRKPLDDLRSTIAFLRAKEIIHFDAHFHNITLMQDFVADLWQNNQKDTKLPHAKLQHLLEETEFFTSADCLQ